MERTAQINIDSKLKKSSNLLFSSLGLDIIAAFRIFSVRAADAGLDSVEALKVSLEAVQSSLEAVQSSLEDATDVALNSVEALQIFSEKVANISENLLFAPQQNGHSMQLGGWEGKIWMSDDFDEPLDDFKEYM